LECVEPGLPQPAPPIRRLAIGSLPGGGSALPRPRKRRGDREIVIERRIRSACEQIRPTLEELDVDLSGPESGSVKRRA
jgi:hypothetical protein